MSEWEARALGEVASITREVVHPSEVDAETAYVGLENVVRGGALVNVRSAGEADLASAKFRFTDQHVLFGKLRPYLAKIARPDFAGVCSTDILPIMPSAGLDRGYLAHFLARPDVIELANSRATGANLPRLSPAELLKFRLPLPPIEEQRRIAAVLDRADELRAKRREALAHLDDLTQSIFLDMFATEVSNSWPTMAIADVAHQRKGSIRTGPFGSQLLHSEFVDQGVAVLGIDNAVSNEFRWDKRRFISEEKYQQLARYTVHPGDVLITIMGTCGRCAVVPSNIPRAINTKHLCCITLDSDRCLPEFLHRYFLTHPVARRFLRQKAKGAIMEGLNMEIIKATPVVLPPLAIQQAFVERLRHVDRVKVAHRANLAEMDTLFASLQDRAFRGLL